MSWARLGRWSRATRRRTGRVRPYRAQPSFRLQTTLVARRESRDVELCGELAARVSQSEASRHQFTRRDGSNGLGSALLVAAARPCKRLGCCSSSELIELRKGLHTAQVHVRQSCHTSDSSLVAQARVTQAVCSQACQVALASPLCARRRCARTHRKDEKTTSTTTAAALLRRYASPGAARGHRRRLALPRQEG